MADEGSDSGGSRFRRAAGQGRRRVRRQRHHLHHGRRLPAPGTGRCQGSRDGGSFVDGRGRIVARADGPGHDSLGSRETGRVVVVDTAHLTCSAASEIAATIVEKVFDSLRKPVLRVTAPDVNVPFSPALEKGLFPNEMSILAAARSLL